MKRNILILTISILTAFPALACNLKKYQKSCLGKYVVHTRVGKSKNKYGVLGKIHHVIKNKKNGKRLFAIKFKGLRTLYYEPASHVKFARLNARGKVKKALNKLKRKKALNILKRKKILSKWKRKR